MQTPAEILKNYRKIAIVGLSADPDRTSYQIARYLQRAGYEIVGINPNESSVLGQPCYPSLEAVPGELEIVNVFRRPEHVPAIVEAAIRRRAKAIWLQLGVGNAAAEARARVAGLDVVSERCIKVEHAILS